ncbi:hypothetical protein H6771_00345 [Candidatus Peribacteria bacterium]|nr:hypothetical protein [Candidatus Peribacteria bacterium]
MSKHKRNWIAGFVIGGAIASVVGTMLRKEETRNQVTGVFGNAWAYFKGKLLHWLQDDRTPPQE